MAKYRHYPHYLAAKILKDIHRFRLRGIFQWQPLPPLEEGCTAIIGMCSKLSHLLAANLHCLQQNRWADLKEVIITVDEEASALAPGFAENIIKRFPALNIQFYYYTPQQARFTRQAKDPYTFSWLSWATCFNHVRTKTVLIQDYDALVLDADILQRRYQTFISSDTKMQGIMWYRSEGLQPEDRLATTFEAFVDVAWIRSFPPYMGYNRVATHNGRWVNFDTYLDMQANHTPPHQRTIFPMEEKDLSHPSQMITQYMRFRNTPRQPLACFSMPAIPFFYYLSGETHALETATQALKRGTKENVHLLGDGVEMNLSQLKIEQLDFALKLCLQALVRLKIEPFKAFYDYGVAFYELCNAAPDIVFKGDFTPEQRQWLDAAKQAVK